MMSLQRSRAMTLYVQSRHRPSPASISHLDAEGKRFRAGVTCPDSFCVVWGLGMRGSPQKVATSAAWHQILLIRGYTDFHGS
jgi:hypothetical protein